jgi:biotin carboxyl carrier protein
MYKIRVDDQFSFEVVTKNDETLVNGEPVDLDVYPVNSNSFHILYQNKSFNAELVKVNREEKTCSVKVNNNTYSMKITDQFDELLHKLGMDNLATLKISDLKAPMPGMVLKVLVSEGEEVKKGANILILEAMKMENIIKSPADLIVKSIKVNPSDKVEKNQVMVVFA